MGRFLPWEGADFDQDFMDLKLIQMLFDGFVQIPLFFLIAYLLRRTSFPNSLALIIVAIFGHQLGLIYENYILYGKHSDMKMVVSYILCTIPLVYTRLQESVIKKLDGGITFFKIISLVEIGLAIVMFRLFHWLIERNLRVMKEPRRI
jgi:hypothetical protein